MECESTLAKVVGRPKELFMTKALLMAESPEMTHFRMAKVAQSTLEAAGMAAHAESADPMSPGLCSKEHKDRKDEQCCSDLFHIDKVYLRRTGKFSLLEEQVVKPGGMMLVLTTAELKWAIAGARLPLARTFVKKEVNHGPESSH
jgi:hypothetical protein